MLINLPLCHRDRLAYLCSHLLWQFSTIYGWYWSLDNSSDVVQMSSYL